MLASVNPSLETEWQATQRNPVPLFSQGLPPASAGGKGATKSSGGGLPSTLFGPELKTGLRVPVLRLIFWICPSPIAQ